MIDTHVHAVNFLQETPGFANLIAHMDGANIQKAVVFGLPVTKQWSEYEREAPEYYLDDDSECYYYSATDTIIAEEYKKLDVESQKRIYPLMCGFNPADKHAIKHIRRMYDMYPNVWCGIGEILLRHDDLTLLINGDTPRINNKALYPIFKFADDYGLPISIHNNISTTWIADRPKYLHELEEILREFPRVKMIFCHCGISRRVYAPFYKKMIERLLLQYPGLHIDYSWIIFDEIICKNEIPDPEWIELTERFSTRILIGSDVIGNFHKIGVINHRYDIFLETLSEETRQNICINNAERLFSETRGKVENDDKRVYPDIF
ncbi:amidohydrolase [Candidatus Gracilibacteria bacterium CG2_30_37_12]|nr:MAG: amidohydrolase [Candidatus Gracilibacteria bacterium CG2_30_37_12]